MLYVYMYNIHCIYVCCMYKQQHLLLQSCFRFFFMLKFKDPTSRHKKNIGASANGQNTTQIYKNKHQKRTKKTKFYNLNRDKIRLNCTYIHMCRCALKNTRCANPFNANTAHSAEISFQLKFIIYIFFRG